MLKVNSGADWPTGFAILPLAEQIPNDWLDKFSSMPSAIISDCLGRNVSALGVKPYHGFTPMYGTALTIRTRPGDNLVILKALQMARPGDVLVIDGGGDLSRAVVGGLMRAMALKAGVAGFVINGALRDRDEWSGGDMPGFALGCVPRGPSCDGPGEINVPIACTGLMVNPGDLIIGDCDGVVAVAASDLPALYDRCVELLNREDCVRNSIRSNMMDKERFDAILRDKGCPI